MLKVVSPLGNEWTRIAVPGIRKRVIMDVGHRGLSSGHFSHNKMVSLITQHFTWPGIRRDVRVYCKPVQSA